MHKKKLILSILTILAVLVWLYPAEQPYKFRQVKRLATAEDNYLLPITPHLSQVTRPNETFHFPIKLGGVGPSNSLYSGRKQYPFYCMTIDSRIGQPLVDNQEGFGVPVYDNWLQRSNIIGYSKDCLFQSHLQFYYLNQDGNLTKLITEQFTQLSSLRAAQRPLQLFRAEQGSINRFIYTIARTFTLIQSFFNH